MSLVAVIPVLFRSGCVDGVCYESAAKVNVLHAVRQRQVSRMVCVATSRSSDPDSECRDDGAASCGLAERPGGSGAVRSTPRVPRCAGDMYRRRPLAYAAVMAVAHVPLLGTWPKTAALTPVTAQRMHRVAQPTLHVQAGSVVQQATVFVRISLRGRDPRR